MNMTMRLVPWENWQIWNEVREGVFSPSPETALNKIAAWKSRSSLPISIEVTADLINIQRRDPHFLSICFPENLITGEMLQLMYSMAIMRLVNGVVDQSKRQNSASVAERADAAGLPRMLVDVRHEVAHKELPSLSVLQLASKKALEWLKIHYWEAQKQCFDESSERLKCKLYAYAASKGHTDGERSRGVKNGGKNLKGLIKSVSAAIPDVVSLLVNEGLMEKFITGDRVWRFVIEELISHVPQLSIELISWFINSGKSDILKTMHMFKFLVDKSSQKVWQSRVACRLVEMGSKAQQLHTQLDGLCESGLPYLFHSKDTIGESRELLWTSDAEGAVETECIADDGAIESNFQRNECVLSEAKKYLHILQERKFGMLSMSNQRGGLKLQDSEELCTGGDGPSKNVWTVTENWRPCAIGKLPSSHGVTENLPSSGTGLFASGKETLVCQETSSCQEQFVGDAEAVEMVLDVDLVNDTVTRDVGAKKDLAEIKAFNGKRGAEANETEEEGILKRFKKDVASITSQDGKENNKRQEFTAGGKKSVLFGVLLLDGVYKTCTSAQLSAIQSRIHLLK